MTTITTLPIETRLRIYEYLFTGPDQEVFTYSYSDVREGASANVLNLLLVNKQVRSETKALFSRYLKPEERLRISLRLMSILRGLQGCWRRSEESHSSWEAVIASFD